MKYSKYCIREDRIVFDFYEFYFSSLRKNNILTVNRINEVDFSTAPYSMEIDNGEIIFFNHDDKESIEEFVKKHQIKESDKVDTWQLICDKFLDTELKQPTVKRNYQKLRQLGFSDTELQLIRKKIKWSFYGTMEWVYLGHWDLLSMKQYRYPFYRWSGKSFYWWTMDIALKGKAES